MRCLYGVCVILEFIAVVSAARVAASTAYDAVSARPGEVPYHVGIYNMKEGLVGGIQHVFKCSGALVHSQYVLTTASCALTDVNEGLAVMVGSVILYGTNNTYVNVTSVIPHELYEEGEAKYDVALLQVDPGFSSEDSEHLTTIDIPEQSVVVGTTCTVSGWRTDVITVANNLKYGNASVFANGDCPDWVEGELCAGMPAENRGCQLGDEGSPLVCGGVVSGVMHYSSGTCLGNPITPALFADIHYQRDWILSIVDLGGGVITTLPSTSTTPLHDSTTSRQTTTPPPPGIYEPVPAAVGDVPYQAALFTEKPNLIGTGLVHSFACAAIVVDPQFVLTTGTCVANAQSFNYDIVVAAGFTKQTDPDIRYHNVTQIIRHPDYDESFGVNDIALLRISPAFEMSDNVSAISIIDAKVASGVTCKVSGWEIGFFSQNRDLRYGNVLTFDTDVCDGVVDASGQVLDEKKLCGGLPNPADGEDAKCLVGDEGTPLVCEGLLTGVFSYTMEYCLEHSAVIYHDAAAYKEWIVEQFATELPATTEAVAGSTTTGSTSRTTTSASTGHTTGEIDNGGGASSLTASVVTITLLCIVTYSL